MLERPERPRPWSLFGFPWLFFPGILPRLGGASGGAGRDFQGHRTGKEMRAEERVLGVGLGSRAGHRFLPLFFFFLILFYLTLQYCIGFAIYQNESATGIHVFPILNPPPSSPSIPSLWIVPVHQPQASSIVRRTWTGDLFHI